MAQTPVDYTARKQSLPDPACITISNGTPGLPIDQGLRGFPRSSIEELQRWGQFLAELHSGKPAAVWRKLCRAEQAPALPVAMVVGDEGNVQFSWDTERHHLDIDIPLHGDPEWFFMDRETDASEEGVLSDDLERLVELLRLVSGR